MKQEKKFSKDTNKKMAHLFCEMISFAGSETMEISCQLQAMQWYARLYSQVRGFQRDFYS